MEDVKIGKYQHYKGNFYQVIGTGRHSETLEEMVIYQALYQSKDFGNSAIWVRPTRMFLEEVIVNDKKVTRFQYISKN